MTKLSKIYGDELGHATPEAVAVSSDLVRAMTSGGSRNGLSGNTEHRPPVYRPGAMDADKHPSRMGDRLYYRDGRVVKMGGAA